MLLLREYAVEPEAIGSDWQTFRYLIEKFGFDRGRLISQFPKNWVKEVYDAARGLPDMERKRIEVKLKDVDRFKLIRSRRDYNRAHRWLDNALDRHAVEPFHAIIAETKPAGQDAVLTASEVDESDPLMVSPPDCLVPRVGTKLAKAMKPMLISARRLLFVDRYFDISQTKYQKTLKSCLDVVKSENAKQVRCEIHFCDHHDRQPLDKIKQEDIHQFLGDIPDGVSIVLYAWQEKHPGEDFHARYLLTDVGGIKIDAGFSAEGGQQNNHLSLLSFNSVQTLSATFNRGSTVYDLVNFLEIAADGTVGRTR